MEKREGLCGESKQAAVCRGITLLMIMALWCLAATEDGISEAAANVYENEYPGIIRFHVIANSDSEEDQALKLAVRDYVLPLIETELAEEIAAELGVGAGADEVAKGEKYKESEQGQADITRRYIAANLERIKVWASDYVRSQGFDYKIKTEIGVRAIPARQYDELYFPAGNYEALTITIGEGAGQNWWCVVFPPLCLIDGDNSAYRETLGEEAGSRIILKSKIKMLLQKADSAAA